MTAPFLSGYGHLVLSQPLTEKTLTLCFFCKYFLFFLFFPALVCSVSFYTKINNECMNVMATLDTLKGCQKHAVVPEK